MLVVTGCCGFVGSRLSQQLLEQGFHVIGIDNLYRQGALVNLDIIRKADSTGRCFYFIQGDVANLDLSFINPDIRAIFHLAGQVAMTKSIEDPLIDFSSNTLSTLRLLEAIRRKASSIRFIYSSTNKVYGDLESMVYTESDTRYECSDYPEGFDERIPLDFSTPYGCSKGAADQYVNDYSRLFGLKTYCFRHSTIYGAGQKATYDQGWVGWFLKQVVLSNSKKDHRFTISGNGKQVRDILHVDDVCRLYQTVAFGDYDSAVANIGGGFKNSSSIIELVHRVSKLLNIDADKHLIDYLEPRQSDQKVFISNNAKAFELFGWKPSIAIHDGVSSALNSILN